MNNRVGDKERDHQLHYSNYNSNNINRDLVDNYDDDNDDNVGCKINCINNEKDESYQNH